MFPPYTSTLFLSYVAVMNQPQLCILLRLSLALKSVHSFYRESRGAVSKKGLVTRIGKNTAVPVPTIKQNHATSKLFQSTKQLNSSAVSRVDGEFEVAACVDACDAVVDLTYSLSAFFAALMLPSEEGTFTKNTSSPSSKMVRSSSIISTLTTKLTTNSLLNHYWLTTYSEMGVRHRLFPHRLLSYFSISILVLSQC